MRIILSLFMLGLVMIPYHSLLAAQPKRFMPMDQAALKHREAIIVPLEKSEQRELNAKKRMVPCGTTAPRFGMRLNRDVLTVQRNVSLAIPYARNVQPPEAQVIAAQNNVSQGNKGVLDLYGDADIAENHPFAH